MSVNRFDDNAWWQTMPGMMLIEQERALLKRWFKERKNICILQIGDFSIDCIKQIGQMVIRIIDTKNINSVECNVVRADFTYLPIQSESIDIVLISHALTADNLTAVLKESYRVLKPNAQLVLLGLNNHSFWRLSQLMGFHQFFFKNQAFLSQQSIKKILSELDMQIIRAQTACFRPPMANKKLADKLLVIDLIGQFLLPALGAIFMIIAQKEVEGVTVIPLLERQQQRQWVTSQVRQTTRSAT